MNTVAQVAPWFERKFELTFPVELFPNLIVRLRGTPARLEEILRGGSRQALTRKPNGKWSAQEHAGHLLDLEPLWMARVEDYVAGSAQLAVADLSNRRTDEANHNSRELEKILVDFREARTALVERAATVYPALHSRVIPHPRLKQPMRFVDHLYFVAEHDDHHLAKIWELISVA
ncbi:MAG TPA: DinB family protein [Terriglobales bacterium]|nr:DinB family protein [Terriglobales bacterium]